MTNLEPKTLVRNFLRNKLTDHNTNRTGDNWVYDDWPHDTLAPNSFPRVAVRAIGESGELIGLSDDDTWDEIIIQIDVLVHSMTDVISITHTDEAVGIILNTPRINLDYPAASVTNVKHNTTPFGTVNAAVNDSDFTSTGTGVMEWSKSTSNLNFSTADLSSYTGQSITSTYVESLEGEQLAMRVGREVAVAIRSQWRSNAFLNDLKIPVKISGPRVIEFGKPEGWHRVMLEYRWKGHNSGEEV